MMRFAFLSPFVPALLAVPALAAAVSPAPPAGNGLFVSTLSALSHRSNGVYSVLEAAAAGDVAALEARLAEGANPSEVDELGNSPLHYAAMGASPRALELLLAAGADPAARDAKGRTPREVCRHVAFMEPLLRAEQRRLREVELDARIAAGDEAAVRSGLAQGVNPSARSADNEGSFLLHAVLLGHAGIANALIEAGAEVDAVTQRGRMTALHVAAAKGDAPLIRRLLEAHANPMLQSENGAYPLHDAIWKRQAEAVRALLPAYAAVNFSPKGGPHGSPLGMALSYGRVELLKAFLEAGFDPNDARLKEAPPLILAVRSGHADCVRLLLEAGADRQMRDARGKTALDYAPEELAPLLR